MVNVMHMAAHAL